MRWTVMVEEIDDRHSARRIRLRYCLAAAIIAAAVAVVLWVGIKPLYDAIAPWLRTHWIWLIFPVVFVLVRRPIRWYLLSGKFIGGFDFWRPPFFRYEVQAVNFAENLIGFPVAFVACCQIDGSVGLWNSFTRSFPGGIAGLIVSVIAGSAAAYALRRRDYPHLHWRVVKRVAFWVSFAFAVLMGSIWAATGTETVAELLPSVVRFVQKGWAPAVLITALAIQVIWWAKRPGVVSELSSSRKKLPGLAGVVLINFLLLMYVVLYWLPGMVVDTSGLDQVEAAAALARERQTLLAITAGVAAGMTLIYTHLRHQLDRDANATDRYAGAVQQLGSENMSIRLGGVYALGRVAKDSRGDRQTIFQLLASFVKERGDTARPTESTKVPLDVIAALRLLGEDWLRALEEDHVGGRGEGHYVELRDWAMNEVQLPEVEFPLGTDLSRADLRAANLRGATFDTGIASWARFSAANLEDSTFKNFHCDSTSFRGANLRNSTIELCYLRNCDMRNSQSELLKANNSTMENIDFSGADLSGATFSDTNLSGAIFDDAILVACDFRDAQLEGASFEGANLAHAVLIGQDPSRMEIAGAVGAEDAIWDEDHSLADHWERQEMIFKRFKGRREDDDVTGESEEQAI